jgi:glutamate-1-semialdehyde 2,1-aminomutase
VRDGLRDIFGRHRFPASVTGVGSTFAVHFMPEPPRNAGDSARCDIKATGAFFGHMLNRGIVCLSPNISHCWISSAHTAADIEEYLNAAEDFVRGYEH